MNGGGKSIVCRHPYVRYGTRELKELARLSKIVGTLCFELRRCVGQLGVASESTEVLSLVAVINYSEHEGLTCATNCSIGAQ